MEILLSWEGVVSLLSLTFMEIVLGIDNIVFISILTHQLPQSSQAKARNIGLSLALFTRVGLLLAITWIMKLDQHKLLDITIAELHIELTIRSIILLLGGLFLMYKATSEIHEKLEGPMEGEKDKKKQLTFVTAVVQIILLDLVFSFDSILTAVGLGRSVMIMIIAVVISMGIMLLSASKISDFIGKHPTVKMLSLAFLLLIGVLLVGEGIGFEIPKGYVYFAIFFSLFVEFLNLKIRKKTTKNPVKLRDNFNAAEGK